MIILSSLVCLEYTFLHKNSQQQLYYDFYPTPQIWKYRNAIMYHLSMDTSQITFACFIIFLMGNIYSWRKIIYPLKKFQSKPFILIYLVVLYFYVKCKQKCTTQIQNDNITCYIKLAESILSYEFRKQFT